MRKHLPFLLAFAILVSDNRRFELTAKQRKLYGLSRQAKETRVNQAFISRWYPAALVSAPDPLYR